MDNKISAILEGLNPEQSKAVQRVEGPVLIVAGAGSGKTKVLTSRVAYIIAMGCDPTRVLALTFTKKAAGEMKERIGLLVGARAARGIVMGTFHSVFVRFLRDYAVSLGYPGTFTIYDRSDSESAVKACVKELGLDDKVYKPREVLARISFAKNALYLPSHYKTNREFLLQDEHSRKPRICDVYSLYQQKLKESGVMDFDDILVNMNILLRDNREALEEIAGRFSYIMVDEYQDTNYAQYLILKKLSSGHRNLCVVGDDSQSIYAFRGAQIQNILKFKEDYPDAEIIRLERNYRSTRNIVDAANSVIAHNEGRIPKTCYSEGEAGEKIRLLNSYTEQEEAMRIVSEIMERMRTEKASYQDFAILYRTNAQSRALEEQLRRRNIPYVIYSGNSFFERAEIKDMMAWFKLCVNVNDNESFKRAVGKPSRGIGDTSMSALNEIARAHGCTLFKAAFAPDFEIYGLRPSAMQKIRAFCELVDRLASSALKGDAYEVARSIYDASGLYEFYRSDTSIEGLARTANLDELLNSVQAFKEERLDDILADMEASGDAPEDGATPELPPVTLADFLENTSLLSNADTAEGEDAANKVALMTVHSAKGLEFPYVYIAGVEENLFPSGGMMLSPADLEEERRLFYVAVTRAKKAVAVSFAGTRMRNGKHESNPPSRFVREIDSRYVENPLPDPALGDYDDDAPGFGSGFRFGSGSRSGAFASSGSNRSVGNRSTASSGYGRSGGYGSSSGSSSGSSPLNYGKSSRVQFFKQSAGGGRFPSSAGQTPRPVDVKPAIPTVPKPDIIDPDFKAVPMTELYVGERVEHNRFGPGKILEITGSVPELKAQIDFDNYGVKLLLLKYAKLRPEK